MIEWAFFKYAVEYHIKENKEVEVEFEIDFTPDARIVDAVNWLPKFADPIEQAMYEKKYNTIH